MLFEEKALRGNSNRLFCVFEASAMMSILVCVNCYGLLVF